MKLIVGFLRFGENDQRFIGSFLIALLCLEDLVPTLLQDAQSSTASSKRYFWYSASSCLKVIAFFALRSSGFSWRSTSAVISFTRSRCASIWAILRSLFLRRSLCFKMPAASSMSSRLSSGRDERMESRLPCEMIEFVPEPRPLSCRYRARPYGARAHIDEIFALTVAIHAAPDGNLREINRQRAIGVVEHKLDFRNAYWLARR